MRLSDLDYELPEELIAQEPLARRCGSDRFASCRWARNRMKIPHHILVILAPIVLFFGFVSFDGWAANAPCEDPSDKATSWSEFNVFSIKVTFPDTTDFALWHGQFDKGSNDIQVDVETTDAGKARKGKILMIGGRVLAIQGDITDPGYEIDALDAPVLEYQAVIRMLGTALPDGPAGLKGVRKIDYSNEKTGFEIATQSAGWDILPPVHVKGTVAIESPDVVEYELALTAGVKGKPEREGGWQRIHFSGRLSKVASAGIDDSTALDGWKIFWLGPYSKKAGTGTIYDYGAQPSSDFHKTVEGIRGDIQQKAETDNYPGQRDPGKDFTGFWETKCGQGFGLQIMHAGSDGKYSVVFCGPRGCLDPGKGHATFITGDKKHYEVVSKDELDKINLDGTKTTYHRCTKDTHPVLKTQK